MYSRERDAHGKRGGLKGRSRSRDSALHPEMISLGKLPPSTPHVRHAFARHTRFRSAPAALPNSFLLPPCLRRPLATAAPPPPPQPIPPSSITQIPFLPHPIVGRSARQRCLVTSWRLRGDTHSACVATKSPTGAAGNMRPTRQRNTWPYRNAATFRLCVLAKFNDQFKMYCSSYNRRCKIGRCTETICR